MRMDSGVCGGMLVSADSAQKYMRCEMKRRFLAVLLIMTICLCFGACGEKEPVDVESEFLDLISEPASEERIAEIGVFLDENLKNVTSERADELLNQYDEYIYNFDKDYTNYSDFIERYGDYMTFGLKQLFEIAMQEQEEPIAENAELTVSWSDLCDRALTVENYITENKDYELVKDQAEWYYEYYINAILMGTTATPVLDYESGQMSEEAKTAYIEFCQSAPETVTAWAINEYFTYLDSIDFTLDYKDATESKVYFDTCTYIVSEAGKSVFKGKEN